MTSPRTIWYCGLAVLFSSLFVYVKFTPIMDLWVLIVYIGLIIFWIWLPMLIMHWYLGSKDSG